MAVLCTRFQCALSWSRARLSVRLSGVEYQRLPHDFILCLYALEFGIRQVVIPHERELAFSRPVYLSGRC